MPAKRRTAGSSDDSGGDYKKKRERNNLAVKKCREKNNEKAKETKERVKKLKEENLKLEGSIELLKKNVKYLKDLLLKNVPEEEHKQAVAKIFEEDNND